MGGRGCPTKLTPAARIEEQRFTQFKLHTFDPLPNGLFAPCTSVPTELLFFDSGKGGREVSAKQQLAVVLVDQIEPCILLVRGQRVMLDADLATLYGTTTKALNQAVKRNTDRFPDDFMFRLTAAEAEVLRSQSVATSGPASGMRSQFATSSLGERPRARSQSVTLNLRSQIVTSSSASHGGRRYLPYAFTEHGAIMAASVLNTPRAIDVSVYVVRAFVRLRELLSTHKELAGKLAELERKVTGHDGAIQSLVAAIRQLMAPAPAVKRRAIGFHAREEGK